MPKSNAQVLRDAADIIDKNGLVCGSRLRNLLSRKGGPCCVLDAIVMSDPDLEGVDLTGKKPGVWLPYDKLDGHGAVIALSDYLKASRLHNGKDRKDRKPSVVVYQWSDDSAKDGTGFDAVTVTAVLRRVADQLDAA